MCFNSDVTADYYVKTMEKILESGDEEYARTETSRMKKLMGKGSTLTGTPPLTQMLHVFAVVVSILVLATEAASCSKKTGAAASLSGRSRRMDSCASVPVL